MKTANHLHEWTIAWVCECKRYFRDILILGIHGSSHKHQMEREVGERVIFNVFRKKTFVSFVCRNVLHRVDNNALCFMSVLKFGWMSTSHNLLVFTAVIKLSAFADDFVKQSAKQFWAELWAKHLDSRNTCEFPQTSHGMVLIVELVREKSSRNSGRKTSFSLVCIHVLRHVDRKSLCSMSVLKLEWMSTRHNLIVFTTVIKLSAFAADIKLPAFADAFDKQSAMQFWVGMWARSCILPEQASFYNMEFMWFVSLLFR